MVAGKYVLKTLEASGYEAYFVGGMVRDCLLGLPVADIDVTTSAKPEEVGSLFEKTYDTGLHHGTVTVLVDDVSIEVTTFRIDSDYLDSRRPEAVTFTTSLEKDLVRRDFTINAMAKGVDDQVHDYFAGREDLKAKVIRAVGKPEERFTEDALRILRAIRFVSKLGFSIEEETLKGMERCRHLMANLSFERIHLELVGILSGDYKAQALDVIVSLELFEYVPYLHVLTTFDALDQIKDPLMLYAMTALELKEPETFLADYPLKKEEKKVIQALLSIWQEEVDQRLLQYYFGLRTARVYHDVKNVYRGTNAPFKPMELTITRSHDLALRASDLLAIFERDPGPWISEAIKALEVAVLVGDVKNDRHDLLQYLENRGLDS